MFNDTQIKKKLSNLDFIKIMSKFSEKQIECTEHTFFRLSKSQKKMFTCDEIGKVLLKDRPFLVGVQYNENNAVFYKYKSKNLKIILSIRDRKVNIVTFYFIKELQIPRI